MFKLDLKYKFIYICGTVKRDLGRLCHGRTNVIYGHNLRHVFFYKNTAMGGQMLHADNLQEISLKSSFPTWCEQT